MVWMLPVLALGGGVALLAVLVRRLGSTAASTSRTTASTTGADEALTGTRRAVGALHRRLDRLA